MSFLFCCPPALQTPPAIAASHLGPYEDIRHMRHAVLQLWDPFLLDIVVRGRIHDGETDQKHIGVGVGEWPQLVVILLQEEEQRFVQLRKRRVPVVQCPGQDSTAVPCGLVPSQPWDLVVPSRYY